MTRIEYEDIARSHGYNVGAHPHGGFAWFAIDNVAGLKRPDANAASFITPLGAWRDCCQNAERDDGLGIGLLN